jgi:hypothetical protein
VTVTFSSPLAVASACIESASTSQRSWPDIVSFMHYDLGFIDLEQKSLQPLDNPFGTRLLPMS